MSILALIEGKKPEELGAIVKNSLDSGSVHLFRLPHMHVESDKNHQLHRIVQRGSAKVFKP